MTTMRRVLWTGALAGMLMALTASPVESQIKHNCTFCHDLHGGGYSQLTTAATAEAVCLSCHDDGEPITYDGPNGTVTVPKQSAVHDNPARTGDPTSCWDCHDHEGSAGTNLFMIPSLRENLPQGGSATITFTANTTQAHFTGTEGVCYVCHTDVATQNTGFAGHNGPDVCTNCHSHNGGFQGAGGGCSGCHNSTRLADGHTHAARRQVVGTGGDYDMASVHVTNVTDDDCVVCHDQRDGHSGDNLGVLLYDHDDGTSIELLHDGDPNTTATEAAKLEQFCVGCHGDGNAGNTGVTFPTGASATQPFSSLATIPSVDATAWAASSHEGNLTGGCYGNGAFGCHGNGHGSNLDQLRAPYNSTLNATTLYEQEEGFCFGCHTNGGTAGTDIQAQFDAATINWAEGTWGQNSITTFNDRHDVQHEASSVSGAKIECVNCHRPHADNSSQKYNPDPDPGSTPPSWTDQTAMDRFCLDCHDGSFPAGVVGHTPAMANIATTYTTTDRMGTATSPANDENMRTEFWVEATVGLGNVTTLTYEQAFGAPPAGNYIMECVQCHRPHPKTASQYPGTLRFDLFSMQDSVRLKGSPIGTPGRAVAYPEEVMGSMGSPNVTPPIWDYGFIEDANNLSDFNSGGLFCNSCHANTSMNGKSACGGGNCHWHGNNGKF